MFDSIPPSELTIRRADRRGRDEAAVTNLMVEYLEWVLATMADEYVDFEGSFDHESVRKGLFHYHPPNGRMLLAELRGVPIGVGALRSGSREIVEIKRMYVRPAARGLHAGSMILDGLINEAKNMKASLIYLDSAWFMTRAHELYESRGFKERAPYEGTEIPEKLRPRWSFFEKRL